MDVKGTCDVSSNVIFSSRSLILVKELPLTKHMHWQDSKPRRI